MLKPHEFMPGLAEFLEERPDLADVGLGGVLLLAVTS